MILPRRFRVKLEVSNGSSRLPVIRSESSRGRGVTSPSRSLRSDLLPGQTQAAGAMSTALQLEMDSSWNRWSDLQRLRAHAPEVAAARSGARFSESGLLVTWHLWYLRHLQPGGCDTVLWHIDLCEPRRA
jgi:hypothetical protein